LTVRHLWLLVPLAAVGYRAGAPLSDNSFLWHVRAGTLQLEAGEVLRTDPFSFTAAGDAWRTQSWLLDLVYGALDLRIDGLAWVPWFVFLVGSALFVFVGLIAYWATRDVARTGLIMILVAWIGTIFMVPRPVLVSFLLLSALVAALRYPRQLAWAMVLLIWVWAAIHGSWVLGVGLIGLEALRRRSARLFATAVVAGFASLATAHGIGTWEVTWKFFANRGALEYLSEWRRPDFAWPLLWPYVLALLAIGYLALRRRLAWFDAIVIVPFAIFGTLAARSVFPALLVLLPFAAQALRPRTQPAQIATTTSPGITWLNRALAVVIVAIALIGVLQPSRINERVLPPAAARAALDPGLVFHGPGAGGVFIYSEWPERLVYIDDRAELYGAAMFEATVAAIEGVGYEAVFDQWSLEQALLKTDWALGERLAAEGWSERYRDENWIVLAR
jgi:hypothetical protein